MQLDFYQHLDQVLQQDIVAIATVIQAQGSVPREVGAKMIVEPTGHITGTIGGGAGEAKVIEAAIALMQRVRQSDLAENATLATPITIDLTGAQHRQTEGVCGGTLQVWISCWLPGWGRAIAQTLCHRLGQGQSTQLVTPLNINLRPYWRAATASYALENTPNLPEALQAEPSCCLVESSDKLFSAREPKFIEIVRPDPTLVIAGAGHVGMALAEVAAFAGFQVIVQDDRPEFAEPKRFQALTARITVEQGAIVPVFDTLKYRDELYLALVTRGVPYDLEALGYLFSDAMKPLQQRMRYIGMIGSRKRVRHVFQQLEKQGIAGDRLASIHAPIGLEIGALTPAEIAISICAQLIRVRRSRGTTPT